MTTQADWVHPIISPHVGKPVVNSWLIMLNLYLQCEAPKIAKLVYNSNNYMVYGIYNYSYWDL
jgi:hypothetical protein